VLSEGEVVFLLDDDPDLLFAARSANTVIGPPPDLEIERIGDLLNHDLSDFLAASPIGVAAMNQERT
jgi:hypothetical protein